MEGEKSFADKIENREKPEFMYHGSAALFDKPRPGLRSRPDNKTIPRLFATPNPAFAAAQGGFEWYSNDGIDVETDEETGQIIFKVPQQHAHKLENPMYMYKMASDTFKHTESERTGHTWDTQEEVELVEPPQKFETVREAVEYFGGRVDVINTESE